MLGDYTPEVLRWNPKVELWKMIVLFMKRGDVQVPAVSFGGSVHSSETNTVTYKGGRAPMFFQFFRCYVGRTGF